ncbi:kinase-like domain-containing protein [Flammula alnicola]|nr:kinase-like domain-containing protein [Flammula alnicola]
MSLFPEEQLDSPVGYLAVRPGQTLDNGEWLVIRKIGWGPRSSSWLAVDTEDSEDYEVLKIFTAAATQESSATKEVDLLEGVLSNTKIGHSAYITELVDHFYEQGPKGKHLCLAVRPLGTSIEALRLSNTESPGTLPLHIVRQVAKVIHGAVTPDNFLFWTATRGQDIRKALARAPPLAPVEEVTGDDGIVYPVIKSQPLGRQPQWNSSREDFADKRIYLNNFRHATLADGNASLDAPPHLLPPEAVHGSPRKVSTKVNIWQLGCAAYLLLTGTSLLSDSYIESPAKNLAETLNKLEELLTSNGKLSEQDIPLTASFLRSCLAIKDAQRPTAWELLDDKWVKKGSVCSCGWSAGDPFLPM